MSKVLQYQALFEPPKQPAQAAPSMDWLVDRVDLTRSLSLPPQGYFVVVLVNAAPSVAPSMDWMRLPVEPTRAAPPGAGQSVEPLSPNLFVAQRLDWMRQTSEPVKLGQPRAAEQFTEPLSPNLFVTQRLDWMRQVSEPLKLTQLKAAEWFVEPILITSTIKIDWYVQPDYRIKPAPLEQRYFVEPLAPNSFVTQKLDWLRQTNEPLKLGQLKAAEMFVQPILVQATIRMDWDVAAEYQTKARPRGQEYYAEPVYPGTWAVAGLSWASQQVELTKARRPGGEWYVKPPAVTEVVTLDKWQQQASDAPRQVKQRVDGLHVEPLQVAQRLDWVQPASVPAPRVAVGDLGQCVEPLLATIPFGWYRQPLEVSASRTYSSSSWLAELLTVAPTTVSTVLVRLRDESSTTPTLALEVSSWSTLAGESWSAAEFTGEEWVGPS